MGASQLLHTLENSALPHRILKNIGHLLIQDIFPFYRTFQHKNIGHKKMCRHSAGNRSIYNIKFVGQKISLSRSNWMAMRQYQKITLQRSDGSYIARLGHFLQKYRTYIGHFKNYLYIGSRGRYLKFLFLCNAHLGFCSTNKKKQLCLKNRDSIFKITPALS